MLPKRYTLVVIDIQPRFREAARHVIRPVLQEIKRAMQDQQPVLFVEYAGHGKTLVKRHVKHYPRQFTATKAGDGGAYEVGQAIRKFNLPRTRLRVCGVNTDCCVFRTVRNLYEVKRIEVIDSACWSNWDNSDHPANHNSGIRSLAELPNVVIVGARESA